MLFSAKNLMCWFTFCLDLNSDDRLATEASASSWKVSYAKWSLSLGSSL